jgi:ureidoacrylate peracid hydrolase
MHKFVIPDQVVARMMQRRGRLHTFETIDPRKTAFVVIDMQHAFLEPGAPGEVPLARELLPNINRIADALREAGGLVAWVNVAINNPSDWPILCNFVMSPQGGKDLVAWLTEGSKGHRMWPGLAVREGDLMVSKSRFSAFLPSACDLAEQLRARSVDTVLIAGTLTNVCCESSARDAAMRDFKTIMVSDANATRSDEEHSASLVSFLQSFGDVRTTDETLALLTPAARKATGNAAAAPLR